MVKLMEQKPKSVSAEELGINPPSEARVSTLFNSVGTGAMFGGAIPFVEHMVEVILKKKPRLSEVERDKQSLVFAACGAAIGVVMGEIEGRRLQAYRHKVSNTISEQESRIAKLEAEQQQWATREDVRRDTKEVAGLSL